MERFEGWAPPVGIWGPWVEIGKLFGTYTYNVDFKTISNAPSTFDAELLYWKSGKLGGCPRIETVTRGSHFNQIFR